VTSDLPDFAQVVAAAARLQGRVRCTPVVSSEAFDRRVGRRVWFKCENLQRGGAFKIRGAMNAVLQMPVSPDRSPSAPRQRVVTHSSGNHGAALALAAADRGFECVVVMPEDSAAPKFAAVAAAGARIVRCAPGIKAREAALAKVMLEAPAELVHPYDDSRVIAGQGTAALELLTEVPTLGVVMAPVGGGGLIGGTALAVRGTLGAGCQVIAAEPAAADDAARSFRLRERQPATTPQTIADGLRGALGVRNFALLTTLVDDVVTVSEAEIVIALRTLLEDFKLLVEASAAVPVAALLAGRMTLPPGDIGVVLSGGNIDLMQCPFLASGSATGARR
jgi:threonine dehydratase